MSSKSLSQIKVGDRIICTASAATLDLMGIVNVDLGTGTGTVVEIGGCGWVDIKFDHENQFFAVRDEFLKIVNRADLEEVEEAVINQIRSRRDAGRSKYGTTMERTDLSILQWVQHAQEEAMDFSIYLEKLKRVLKEKGIE